MTRVKIAASVVAAGLAAVLLAGCGQTAASGSQSASSQSSASQPQPATAKAVPTELVRADSREVNAPASATATLVLFTDYQCPYCAKMDLLIQKTKAEYADSVRIVVRNYPLPMHQNAPLAAQAVEAAAEQGALEPMASAVFLGQQSWAKATEGQRETLRGFAQGLGLDMARFDADFASAKVQNRVAQDLQDATALGLKGTPSVVLNGSLLSVDSSEYATLKNPIDQVLAG